MFCRCEGKWKGRVCHDMDCHILQDFFLCEDIINKCGNLGGRRPNETVEDYQIRLLKHYYGIYYPWRNTDETGGD